MTERQYSGKLARRWICHFTKTVLALLQLGLSIVEVGFRCDSTRYQRKPQSADEAVGLLNDLWDCSMIYGSTAGDSGPGYPDRTSRARSRSTARQGFWNRAMRPAAELTQVFGRMPKETNGSWVAGKNNQA